MKSLVKTVLMVVMAFMGAVIIGQADMEAVKAASITTDYYLCEGQTLGIDHTGEDWVIEMKYNVGTVLVETDTILRTDMMDVYSNKSEDGNNYTTIYAKKSNGTKVLESRIEFRNKTTGDVYICKVYIYPKVTNLAHSESYINDNNEIWMYEGDSLTTTTSIYMGTEEKNVFAIEARAEKIDSTGTVTDANEELTVTSGEKRTNTINALKAGDYVVNFSAITSANMQGDVIGSNMACYTESVTVRVRKKPMIVLPTDIYMNVNSERALTCSVDNTEKQTDVSVTWENESGSLIDYSTTVNDKVVTISSNEMEGIGTVTLTYTDEVINNNPHHDPEKRTCYVHVVREGVNVTANDGTDLLTKGVTLTGTSLSTVINCNTDIESLSSTNVDVAAAMLNGNSLSISRVAPGACEIVIKTVAGREYRINVTVKALAPTLTVQNNETATLSWNATFGAVGYDVYRAETKTGNYIKIGTTKSTTFTDVTSIYSKTYYYKVVAVAANTQYNSADSNVVSCTRIPAESSTSSSAGTQAESSTSSHVGTSAESIASSNTEIKTKETVNKTKVKKATKTGKKLKLTLKKVKGAKGYKVQVSKGKKFTKKNILVKKTVKKIKPAIKNKKFAKVKKLYVRARAYKIVNGKKVWSKWSVVKKVAIFQGNGQ